MFKWLFKKPQFYQYPDNFAFTQSTIDDAILEAVRKCVSMGHVVLLVNHFPETFSQTQKKLEQWKIEFDIPTTELNAKSLPELVSPQGCVLLTLSQMLGAIQAATIEIKNRQLSILVLEKYPLHHRDDQIEHFARRSNFRAKLGYYLSFEQRLIDYCFGDNERKLLKHWTSIDDIVFTSALASRRIDARIKSMGSAISTEASAESIEQWIESNLDQAD